MNDQKIKTVKKVLIYALRKREQLEVLVFDHMKYPEVSPQLTGKGEDEHLQFKYYWLPVDIAQDKLQANLGDGFKMFGDKIELPPSRGN